MRWVLFAMLAGGMAVGLAAVRPGRGPAGPEPRARWSPVEWAGNREGEEADLALVEVGVRIREKEAAAQALMRGDLTPDAAVARFRAILAREPRVMTALRAARPGVADADLARAVLAKYLERVGAADPVRAARLIDELRGPAGQPAAESAPDEGGPA